MHGAKLHNLGLRVLGPKGSMSLYSIYMGLKVDIWEPHRALCNHMLYTYMDPLGGLWSRHAMCSGCERPRIWEYV